MRLANLRVEDAVEPDCPWAHEKIRARLKGWAAGLFRRLPKILADRRVVFLARIVLAAIFLASAAGKLIDIDRYSVGAVYEFHVLPNALAHAYGLALPFVELACALGLFFGLLTRLSALGIGALSISFFAAKGIILLKGQDIICGCFGPITSTLASVSIYADPPILLMALIVMVAPWASRNWLSMGKVLSGRAGRASYGRGSQTLRLAISAPRLEKSFRD